MTQVFDMRRGCYIAYTLSPWDAVIAAHHQYDRRNWNTWMYESMERDPVHVKTVNRRVDGVPSEVSMVSCGNFSTLCPIGKEREYVPQDYELERRMLPAEGR